MSVLIDPELDVLPKLLIELREDETVAGIVGKRIRGKDPEGPILDGLGREIEPGDLRPAGSYVPFVVLKRLGGLPHPRLPIATTRTVVLCYGRTDREAAVLRNACAAAIHGRGPRVHSNGLAIYASHDVTGGEQEQAPENQQPLETFVIEAIATTQVATTP